MGVRTFEIDGKKLAKARVLAGLSQKALGDAIGRTENLIAKAEAQSSVRMFHAVRAPLAQALKIPETALLERLAPDSREELHVARDVRRYLKFMQWTAADLAEASGLPLSTVQPIVRTGKFHNEETQKAIVDAILTAARRELMPQAAVKPAPQPKGEAKGGKTKAG